MGEHGASRSDMRVTTVGLCVCLALVAYCLPAQATSEPQHVVTEVPADEYGLVPATDATDSLIETDEAAGDDDAETLAAAGRRGAKTVKGGDDDGDDDEPAVKDDDGDDNKKVSKAAGVSAKEKEVKGKLKALAKKPVFKDKGESPLDMTVAQLVAKEKGIKDKTKKLVKKEGGSDDDDDEEEEKPKAKGKTADADEDEETEKAEEEKE